MNDLEKALSLYRQIRANLVKMLENHCVALGTLSGLKYAHANVAKGHFTGEVSSVMADIDRLDRAIGIIESGRPGALNQAGRILDECETFGKPSVPGPSRH